MPIQKVNPTDITNVSNTSISGTITGSQISANTVTSTNLQTGSVENYMSSQGLGLGMRNRIINGGMVIDQRLNGGTVTSGNFTNTPQSCDLWYLALGNGGTGTTVQRVTDAPAGFSNSLKWTGRTSSVTLGSGNWDAIFTVLEGYNIADFNWGSSNATPVTLSFWVKGSIATTMSLAIYNPTSGYGPGSSGATRNYLTTYTINSPNTWEKKTITIPGETTGTWGSTNSTGMVVYWNLNSGSSFTGSTVNSWQTVSNANYVQTSATATNYMVLGGNPTFQLTGVQLEKGSVATPFEYRHYTHELALCQRYYEICTTTHMTGVWDGVSTFRGSRVGFSVKKRSTPTSSIISGSARWSWPGNNYASADTLDSFIVSPDTHGFYVDQVRTSTAGIITPSAGGQTFILDTAPTIGFNAEL